MRLWVQSTEMAHAISIKKNHLTGGVNPHISFAQQQVTFKPDDWLFYLRPLFHITAEQ